jgi:hypothetical protein
MRHVSLFLAAALAVSAHADDEHRPTPPVPKVAPWMTGADLLRKLNTPVDNASAEDYIKGIHDATERRDWCYRAPDLKPIAKPRPADMLAMVRSALTALPASQLKRNAADLVRQVWEDKWVCPTDGCCYE